MVSILDNAYADQLLAAIQGKATNQWTEKGILAIREKFHSFVLHDSGHPAENLASDRGAYSCRENLRCSLGIEWDQQFLSAVGLSSGFRAWFVFFAGMNTAHSAAVLSPYVSVKSNLPLNRG
jgi:hypothetical protein